LEGIREFKLDKKDEINIDILVDNLLIKNNKFFNQNLIVKKTSDYQVFSSKKHNNIKNVNNFFKKKTIKRILSGFILIILFFALWASGTPQLYADIGSDIIVYLEPSAVYNGETIHINVSIPSHYNITSLTADMGGEHTIDLVLIENETDYHIWAGSWIVNDMAPGYHIAQIFSLNSDNVSYLASVEWQVLEIVDNSTQNGSVPPEININDSLEPYNNGSIPPSIEPDTNGTSNESDINLGLNLSISCEKSVYFVNETITVAGLVYYNNSLIDTEIIIDISTFEFNLSDHINSSNGTFIYEFIPIIAGNFVLNATVHYRNETAQTNLVFNVIDRPIENVSENTSNLSIWDDFNSQVRYIGDQVTFYANYSSFNGSIENASCLISFNISGWTEPELMNYIDGYHVFSRTFNTSGMFEFSISCSSPGFEKITLMDMFVISEIVSNDTVVSIIDPKVKENVYVVPGTSFYIERSISGLNNTEVIFAPLYTDSLILERIEIINNNSIDGEPKVKEILKSNDYRLGKGVSKSEKKLDKIREKLIDKMEKLDSASLSDLIILNEPLKIRVWFKAPSWDDIITGKVPSSGKISYLVFSDDSDDFDFEGSTWWNSGWLNRKLITVNCSQVYDVLSNFPILINTTDSDLATNAQDDGDDIAFVLYSDNTTKLNHEIEWFNGTSGELVAWVNVTSLSSSQSAKIWMYYGNSACNNQQNPTGVWDSNFIAVWHLKETSGTCYDSTSNNRDSSAIVGVTQDATGIVDGGDSFDGSNDYIDITMTLPSTVTISVWATYTGTTDMLWCIDSDNGGPDLFFVSGVICLNTWDSAGNPFCSIPADVNQWYLYTTVIQSGNTNLYLNDQLGGTANYRNPSGSDFHISSSAGYDWQGKIDEVRISNIARNSSWIKTSYNTIKNSSIFVIFGSEELSAPVLSSPVPSDGTTGVFVPPSNFNITVSDPNSDNINITWCTNASGSWFTFNTTGGGSGVSTGTYNVTNTSWVNSYLTKYWWSVNVTDGTLWTNTTYNFTTKPENNAPTISNIYPSNSSTGIDQQVTCSIQVNDVEEDTMTVYWFNSSDGISYNYQQINSSVTSGETLYWNYSQANTVLTTYYWKVAVNDTKDNITAWYKFTTRSSDYIKPSSNLTTIPQYWYSSSSNPLTITCNDAQDNTGGDGLKNVTLYYYYSTDNNTWNGPCNFGVDVDPWIQCSWSFTFPNSTGYYRFYSIATDNATPANIEDPPVTNDTECGYDIQAPSSSIDTIAPYNVISSTFTINATASDSHSNVKNVTLWYRYSTENSSWWNDSWLNRKPINFYVSSGSTSSDYQVLLNITYISGMNSNFSDLRFVNYSNNSNELDYWIESKSDGNWANVWLEINSPINTSNQSLAWMYYGNPGASTKSNGKNTFVFFDDFDSFDTNKWTATGSYSMSSSQLTITTGAVYTDNTISSQSGLISEAKIKWNNFAGYSGLEIANAQSTQGSNGGRNNVAYLMTNSGGSSSVTAWAADGTTTSYNIVSGAAQFSATAGITYIIGHAVTSSNVIFYRDRTITNSYIGTWSNSFYLWLGYFTGSASGSNDISDIVIDWVLVRNYFSSTTTYYIGNETWICWNNANNPDLSSPWSWIFDFPDGPGYYDFHSIAKDAMGNKENSPSRADAICRYVITTIDIIPDEWNIGTTTIGNYNYSTSGYYFNLTNNGTIALDIQIKASNAINETTGAEWNLSSTPGLDNYSLQYNKSSDFWTNINQTYETFMTNLEIGSWQTFDLNIFMATTSTKHDLLSVTITFRSVVP
jgi:hypothetical protein